MKGYILGICFMMVGTIALAYNNLDYRGYPSVTGCYGECYEEYVRVNGTMAEILQAKRAEAESDPFSSVRGLWAGCAACHDKKVKVWQSFLNLQDKMQTIYLRDYMLTKTERQ